MAEGLSLYSPWRKQEYIYITYRNLLIVFLLCGIWHGANFTFIVWGLWHGFFICLERAWLGKKLEKLPSILQHSYLILVVLLGWVFFKAEDLSQAFKYISALFRFNSASLVFTSEIFSLTMLVIGILICFLPQKFIIVPTSHTPNEFKFYHLIFQFIFSCFSVLLLLSSNRNPFIYFNF